MLETDQLPDNVQSTKDRKEWKNKSRGKLTPDVQGQTLSSSSNALRQTLKIPPMIAQFVYLWGGWGEGRTNP